MKQLEILAVQIQQVRVKERTKTIIWKRESQRKAVKEVRPVRVQKEDGQKAVRVVKRVAGYKSISGAETLI